MNQDEFETLLASLASQYAEACEQEIEALTVEAAKERAVSMQKTLMLSEAYGLGKITGKNAELRKVQRDNWLLQSVDHQTSVQTRDVAILARKWATMVRIGIENEWKTWRAWLVSQGGGKQR